MLNTILAGFYDDLMKQITQSTAKENIEMKFEQHGKKLEEWVWEFRKKAEQEIKFPETGPDQPISSLEQIGREKLAELDCVIAKIGYTIFDNVLNGLKHIAYRDELLQSIMEYSGMRAQEFAGNTAEPVPPNTENPEPPENVMPPHKWPEDDPIQPPEDDQLNMDDSLPGPPPISEPNLTENERLEMLEDELRYAVNTLYNTKMAHRVKTLRQLLADLANLADTEDMPECQRGKTIEAELRKAIDILGESSCAARSKVTIDLREHLIELLEKVRTTDGGIPLQTTH